MIKDIQDRGIKGWPVRRFIFKEGDKDYRISPFRSKPVYKRDTGEESNKRKPG